VNYRKDQNAAPNFAASKARNSFSITCQILFAKSDNFQTEAIQTMAAVLLVSHSVPIAGLWSPKTQNAQGLGDNQVTSFRKSVAPWEMRQHSSSGLKYGQLGEPTPV
jgi:hypothetical protein